MPYVRNLTYACGDGLSAQVAVEALSCYAVEDSESVKAQWIDGGPSEVIFAPWQSELERRRVTFLFQKPVESLLMSGNAFQAFVTQEVMSDRDSTTRPSSRRRGHAYGEGSSPHTGVNAKLVPCVAVCS